MILTDQQKKYYYDRLKDKLGEPMSLLCAALKVDRETLTQILAALQLNMILRSPGSPRKEFSRESLEVWLHTGLPAAQIAREMDISESRLRRLLRRHGLKLLPGPSQIRQHEAQGLRRCVQCMEIKPLATDFREHPSARLGQSLRCIACETRATELVRSRRPTEGIIHVVRVPKAVLESLIQSGKSRTEIERALGISYRPLKRLLRSYGLSLPSQVERSRQLAAQGLRRCVSCKQLKNLETDFGICRTAWLGRNPRCKTCLSKQTAEYVKKKQELRQAGVPEPVRDRDWRMCQRCHQRKRLFYDFDADPKSPRGRSVRCLDCLAAARHRATVKQCHRDLAALGLRLCMRCHEVKNLTEDFTIDHRDPVGRKSLCRHCEAARRRPRRARRPGLAIQGPAAPIESAGTELPPVSSPEESDRPPDTPMLP